MNTPTTPQAAPEPVMLVSVNRDALRRVLEALNGPGHLIRELQATRGIEALSDHVNPINELIRSYNEAVK
jgi:hypothetical protein